MPRRRDIPGTYNDDRMPAKYGLRIKWKNYAGKSEELFFTSDLARAKTIKFYKNNPDVEEIKSFMKG